MWEMYWRGGKLQSIGEVDILEKQMQNTLRAQMS